MTTPEDREKGATADQQAERAAWGRQPAGGWGEAPDPTHARNSPAGDEATRVDAPRGAHPVGAGGGEVHGVGSHGSEPYGGDSRGGGDVAPADATRLEHPTPGGGHGTRQWGAGPDPQAPVWAQQPGPGGGWNQQQAPYPTQQFPPPPHQGPPHQGPYHQGPYHQGPQQGATQQVPPWGPPSAGGYPPGAAQGGQWGAPDSGGPGRGAPPQPWGGGPGGPGYPPPPGPTRSRRSRLPLVLGGVAVLALALFLVLGFVAPGFLRTTVFDRAALQSGVQRVLTDDYRYAGVGEVSCGTAGETLQVRTGAEFTCGTTIDGAPATIPVRVTSDTGDYEVSRPL